MFRIMEIQMLQRPPRGADTDAFKVKNCREGLGRNTTMPVATHEFIGKLPRSYELSAPHTVMQLNAA